MKKLIFALLLASSSFLLAQDSSDQGTSKAAKGAVTMQGCVSRSAGDYILMKQDPAVSYELQPSNKIKLSRYLGQRVEVVGTESPSMSTSSDTSARSGSPSSETLTITSIKTLAKECSAR